MGRRPSTLIEKILSTHTSDPVEVGRIVNVRCDLVVINDAVAHMVARWMHEMGAMEAFDRRRVVVVADHYAPANDIRAGELLTRMRDWAFSLGVVLYDEGRGGIEHPLVCEEGLVLPGSVLVATDSHACTCGALGAYACGLGTADVAALCALGQFWEMVPATIRIELIGTRQPFLSGKDVILAVIGRLGVDGGGNGVLEFVGDGVAGLGIDERMAIANMAVEVGAETAIFAADPVLADYLTPRTSESWETLTSDPGADFLDSISLRLDEIPLLVATPGSPGNVRPLAEVAGTRVDRVHIGNCGSGTITDLRAAADVFRGRHVSAKTRAIVIPGTQATYMQALAEGLLAVFVEADVQVSTPTCGACAGMHTGVLGPGETAVATINRNYPGRMGAHDAHIYLANPYVAAAAAVAGELVDPSDVLGKTADVS